MGQKFSAEYDRRVAFLAARYKHPVYRRLVRQLVTEGRTTALIHRLCSLVREIFGEVRARRSHGTIDVAHLSGMYARNTLLRYLAVLTDLKDAEGGYDFILEGTTLTVPHYHASGAQREQAELAYSVARARSAARVRRHRKARRDWTATPQDLSLRRSLEAICEMKRPLGDSVFLENTPTEAGRSEHGRQGVGAKMRPKKPGRPSIGAPYVAPKLLKLGYKAQLGRRYAFTEYELEWGYAKVSRAKTVLHNPGGALVNAILQKRSGAWVA